MILRFNMADQRFLQQEYSLQLDRVLRTNPRKKSEKLLERFTRNAAGSGDVSSSPLCMLSQAIRCNQRCINNLQTVRDNLLSAFMAMNDSLENGKSREEITRHLALTISKLINLVGESSSLTQKISENAMGLHVAADFLRNINDLQILDFSKSGRIPVSHFSCNEATTMCLTWLHTSAEKLLKSSLASPENEGPIRINSFKIFSSFETAMAELRDASLFATQVFRVLLYCNDEGKKALQEFLASFKPPEINDAITEIQTLRRQFDEINIILEKLGWSLADIWTRCTGIQVTFEDIRKEGVVKINKVEHPQPSQSSHVQTSIKKSKSEKILPKSISMKKNASASPLQSSRSKLTPVTSASTKKPTKPTVKPDEAVSSSSSRKKSAKILKKDARFASKLLLVLGKPADAEVVSAQDTEIDAKKSKLAKLPKNENDTPKATSIKPKKKQGI